MANMKSIKVEIEPEIIMRLLKNKQMFASEMRYLDGDSKQTVKEICLEAACFSKNS